MGWTSEGEYLDPRTVSSRDPRWGRVVLFNVGCAQCGYRLYLNAPALGPWLCLPCRFTLGGRH